MSGSEHDADLAVGLEASNTRAVSGPRVNDDERAAGLVNPDALWWDDPRQEVIDGTLERAAVQDQFRTIAEDVRHGLGDVFVVLIATLSHHVCEKHSALRGVGHIFQRLPHKPGPVAIGDR
jgi:hypothetical protein